MLSRDLAERRVKCDEALTPVLALRDRLRASGFEVSEVIVVRGGRAEARWPVARSRRIGV